RKPSVPKLQTNFSDPTIGTRKSQAAKDLEARRRSLARRPSAPVIVHPKDLGSPGSTGAPRLDFIPTEQDLIHGHSGDAEPMVHVGSTATGTSTSSVPIGLPSNPRAMRHTKYMSAEPDEDDNMQSMAYISSTIQRPPTTEPALLPAMVFVPPSRAASAPLEKMLAPNAPRHISRESLNTRPIHSRMSSLNEMIIEPSPPPPPPPPPGPFIDRNSGLAVLDSSVVIVQDRDSTDLGGTVILPELQHLANAGGSVMGNHPPSNSSSTSLGVINIGISTPEPMTLNAQHLPASVLPAQPPPMEMSSTPSHRRGHGSVGGNIADTAATHGGIGGKLRGVRDRLRDRSASRNRTKSPPRFTHSPYESISGPMEPRSKSVQPILTTQQYVSSSGSTTNLTLPSVAYNAPGPTLTQATYNPNAPNPSNLPSTTTGYRTPKEIARAVMQQSAANAPPVPPVPPLPPGPTEHLQFGINAERTAPQGGLPSNMAGYRNPKDIRANMPPNSLQPGTGPRQTLNGEPF
ncbi:MAG TPA: hypothetical protein VHV10_03390, partial [Ktedonobacteraceae bacterium]|nr:hypothetical protein [Ktedonobacteraceae bacterium]